MLRSGWAKPHLWPANPFEIVHKNLYRVYPFKGRNQKQEITNHFCTGLSPIQLGGTDTQSFRQQSLTYELRAHKAVKLLSQLATVHDDGESDEESWADADVVGC